MNYLEAYEEYINYISIKLKPQSVYKIKQRFKSQILYFFQSYKIEDINFKLYLQWQNEIEKKDLSFKYKTALHYCNVALFTFLNTFYKYDNIPSKIGNFKNKFESQKKITYWNIEEFEKFLNVINDPVDHTLIEFLFFTGCRFGEANSLKFCDLDDDIISISKTITKECYEGKRLITTPKTKKSIREIRIDDITKKDIYKLKDYYINKFGYFNENFYIFGGIKPIAPTTFATHKNKYCDISGVKKIAIKNIRHSNTTLLLQNNVPIKDVADRLGHEDINITMKIYAQINSDKQKRVVNTINSLRSLEL